MLTTPSFKLYPAMASNSVIDAAVLFERENVTRVRLIVDADFDRQLGLDAGLPSNLILTEFYDLDADIYFNCPEILVSMLANHCDRTKLRSYLHQRGTTAAAIIIDLAGSIGMLRYRSIRDNLQLRMRDFPTTGLISEYEASGSAAIEIIKMAKARSIQNDLALDPEDLSNDLKRVSDLRFYCNGHDIVAVLASLVRKRWGGQAGATALAGTLRSAVSCACWQRTRAFDAISLWSLDLDVAVWTC